MDILQYKGWMICITDSTCLCACQLFAPGGGVRAEVGILIFFENFWSKSPPMFWISWSKSPPLHGRRLSNLFYCIKIPTQIPHSKILCLQWSSLVDRKFHLSWKVQPSFFTLQRVCKGDHQVFSKGHMLLCGDTLFVSEETYHSLSEKRKFLCLTKDHSRVINFWECT